MKDCCDAEHGHECIACCVGGCIWVEVNIRTGPVNTGVEVDIHCEGVVDSLMDTLDTGGGIVKPL